MAAMLQSGLDVSPVITHRYAAGDFRRLSNDEQRPVRKGDSWTGRLRGLSLFALGKGDWSPLVSTTRQLQRYNGRPSDDSATSAFARFSASPIPGSAGALRRYQADRFRDARAKLHSRAHRAGHVLLDPFDAVIAVEPGEPRASASELRRRRRVRRDAGLARFLARPTRPWARLSISSGRRSRRGATCLTKVRRRTRRCLQDLLRLRPSSRSSCAGRRDWSCRNRRMSRRSLERTLEGRDQREHAEEPVMVVGARRCGPRPLRCNSAGAPQCPSTRRPLAGFAQRRDFRAG